MTNRQRKRPSAASTTLWAPSDLAVTAVLVAVGSVLWFAGWYSASDKLVEGDQMAALNVSAAGTLIANAGLVSWFLNGRRAIRTRRRALLERRRAQLASGQTGAEVVDVVAATLEPRSSSPMLVGGPGLRRYHRADCPLAAGRQWPVASRTDHEDAGRIPCGACRP